jgi:hypothetical protein
VSAFDQLLNIVEEQPLSRSLAVALRIATSIEDEELTSSIKLELMGYLAANPEMKEDTIVPEYRAVPGQWYDDYGLVLALNDLDLAFINEFRLRHGVAELEGIAAGTKPLVIRPVEFSEIIRNNINVEVSVFKFRPSSVSQVLTNSKVHLIDRVVSQREKISAIPEIQVPQETEILQIKPNIYGVGIDLKALWRRLFKTNKL